MKLRFMSLASGSNGNCYYLGTDGQGILIDAGIAARTLRRRLKDAGVPTEDIRAVFVTHDHADHVRGVASVGEGLHIPVYATAEAHRGIAANRAVRARLTTSARLLRKGEAVDVGAFRVEAFDVPHDAADCSGYCVEALGRTFVFLTDLGHLTPLAASYAARAHFLVIEANYDADMLLHGSYPPYLKARIAGPTGHMDNADTADFLARRLPPHLLHVWLCHLSRENNRPDLALHAVETRLLQAGVRLGTDLKVEALPRTSPSALYEWEAATE